MEQLDLTTPETQPANPRYVIAGINETWLPLGQEAIEIRLLGANGETKTVRYGPAGLIGPTGLVLAGTPTGATLLKAQNKANFSVNSRQKQIFTRLGLDGVLVGTVSGVPD